MSDAPLFGMSRKQRRVLLLVGAFVTGVLVVLLWVWRQPSEPDALRRMPPENRAKLFQQTYDATRTLCDVARTDDALRERCAGSASFLVDFPECDDACRTFAGAYINAKAAR